MSPLYVFVQLYFSSLLRSLRHKLWWKYILFQFQYYFHYIVITFSFSYHYRYVHYAVIKTKRIIFLVNNKISFATSLLLQDLEKLHILVSLLPLRLLQRDSGKKYYLDSTLTTFSFLPYPRFLLPLPCHDQGNSFFHFFATFTTSWSKEKKLIWSLRSLRHNLRVKKVFFSFSHHLHYAMIKKKKFFSCRHYVKYAMVTEKEIWFLLNHYFDYATIMKEMFYFISLGLSL